MTDKKQDIEKYEPGKIEKKWPHKSLTSRRRLPASRSRGATLRGKQDYDPSSIEKKWQEAWEEKGFYQAVDFDKRPKYYTLIEFPYPSGAGLHVGHVRSWSAMDAYSRQKRMQGFNVLYPIGWDAFGLPAENYALKMGVHPSRVVPQNIASFKTQCKSLGLSFDWSREINTTDPDYYKWTQWIFLKFFEQGLAYQADVAVNWCSSCKINLADEEVLPNGTHERCGTITEKKMQKQWLLKITSYADRLIEDLKLVDYSTKIRVQQENWIGRSEGVRITFKTNIPEVKITVFTTALDTIFGTTFMVISPEMAKKYLNLIDDDKKELVSEYIEKALRKSELERQAEERVKTGVDIGIKAVNPFNGQESTVFVADYVLASYGTGAVMGVPGHDARDYEFAKKYRLEIIPVIKPAKGIEGKIKVNDDGFWNYSEIKENSDKAVLFNSDSFDGLTSKVAKKKLEEELVKRGIGEKIVNYHLRDWVFSRQHYWGEPIPIIYCRKCWEVQSAKCKVQSVEGRDYRVIDGQEYAIVPVPEDQLPVELPYVEKYEPSGTGESPLANVTEWVNTTCPKCGGNARRETDTMPNWAGSNWYFLRYLDPENNSAITDKEKMEYWMPVDLYQGGFEHTTLHLLYSRFVYKFLYDIGAVPTSEPYAKRRSHGIVLGPDGRKMSKSFGNVISPDDIVGKFGADTLRVYEMFMGPFDQTIAWSEEGVEGCFRFLKRVWRLINDAGPATRQPHAFPTALTSAGPPHGAPRLVSPAKSMQFMHKTIKKVTEDIESLDFNTAVSALMEWLNFLSKQKEVSKEECVMFVKLLAPFAPHLTEELWQKLKVENGKWKNKFSILNSQFSIHNQPWPKYDPKFLEEEEATIVVQVNGKIRDTIRVESCKLKVESEIEQLARESDKVKKYLDGKTVDKVIYVEGKIINFVTR